MEDKTIDKKLIKELRAQLVERKAELLEEIEDTEEAMASHEQSHHAEDAEEAQEEAAELPLKTLDEAERRELRDIERALIKMDNDTFGICEKCGSKIRRNRLEALPPVRYCLSCEESLEGGGR